MSQEMRDKRQLCVSVGWSVIGADERVTMKLRELRKWRDIRSDPNVPVDSADYFRASGVT